MMKFSSRVPSGPTFKILVMALAILGLGLAGCSEDLPTQVPDAGNDPATGVFHVNRDATSGGFEILSSKSGDPEDPIEGPFAIRGSNIRYDGDLGALVMDLTVTNLGEDTFDEMVMLTFLGLLPEGVTVLNPDNEENGAGAAIMFEFENDDAMWTPGEESLPREVQFGVAEGTAIGFTARLDTGMGTGTGSIGGMVWNDANGDGMMDEGEGGVAGAMIELGAEGMDAMMTTTVEDGTYRFDDLDPGFYMVSRKAMDGMVGTTANMMYVILVHEDGTVDSFMAANFGVMADDGGPAEAIIKGMVWNDLNGDGKKNDDEPGLEGITVMLSGDAADTTATGADGSYAFEMLTRGSYEVVSVGLDGWSLTTGSPIQVILDANDAVFNEASFGWAQDAVPLGSISGVVFNDLNGNKVRDDGEPGLEGIKVNLLGIADAAITDADGMYGFSGLTAGTYAVSSVGPEGWVNTTGPLNVKLDADDSVVDNADHGWMEESIGGTGSISGVVFNDLNGNKLLDPGEPGLEGLKVTLAAGLDTESVNSDADGMFSFTGLSAGEYTVISVGPEGWVFTTGLLSVNLDADDSIVEGANLGWREESGSGTGGISGIIFNDLNGNKVKDDGEPGLEGIEVNLTGDGNSSVTTNEMGLYLFLGLSAGDYTVDGVGPVGWVSTTGALEVTLDTDFAILTDVDQGWMEEVVTP